MSHVNVADLTARIEEVKRNGVLRPAAVIPVDLFGSPAYYPAIHAIARKENLFVLADGAQGFGGRLGDRWVGNLAPATATSFFPGKSLGAYGDAGAILAQDLSVIERWMSIRWHGTDSARKNSVCVGFNGRMDTFQAAVLLEKLAIFDEELEARLRIAAQYERRLSAIARPQRHLQESVSGFSYFSLRLQNRDAVAATLKAACVPTAIYYPTPLYKMPAFEAYAPSERFAATETICAEILSLPMHPYLTPDQVDYICDRIESALRRIECAPSAAALIMKIGTALIAIRIIALGEASARRSSPSTRPIARRASRPRSSPNGWPRRGVEAAAQAGDPRIRLDGLDSRHGVLTLDLWIDAAAAPAEPPKQAAFMRLSTATGWVFDTSEARLGR